MLRFIFILALVGRGLSAFAGGPTDVRIIRLEPTVLFARQEPLRQIAWLQVENPGSENIDAQAVVTVDGAAQPPQALVLVPGPSRQNILIPDLKREAEVEIELRSAAGPLASVRRHWRPQRKWKIFVVKSSHEDIGYENFLWVKQKEIADFIDLGRHLSAQTPVPVEEGARTPGGYHYWFETMLFPRYYGAERGEAALRELIEQDVKPGHTPLGAAPSGLHLHWMDYEELVRTTYPGRRDFKDRFDLDLDTYAIVDNPSFSWSSAQVLADAGYKYAVRFGQPFRTGGNNDYRTTHLPALFWWEGPDAKSRVLFTWRNHYGKNFWFGQTAGGYTDLSDLGAVNVQREIAAVQSGEELGPYPWDALLIPSYRDHEIPTWDNRALRRWQELYRYPEIRIANPRDFMVYIEKNYGAQLPVLRGDLNNFSADYATIDPESQGWTRRASREIPFAEGIAAAAGITAPGFGFRQRETGLAYRRLFDFSEHSWPTSPPPREVHQFNAQWGKRLEGRRALGDASRLLERSFTALGAQIPTGPEREIVVFNPLAHPRTDLVVTAGKLPALLDPVTGAPVPTQELSTGETVFVAAGVPALGYKIYRVADGAPPMPEPTPAGAPRAVGTKLENEFYTVTFDAASGAITSIVDRQLQRELVDSTAPQQFNQIVYVAKNGRESKEGTRYSPKTGATLTPRAGRLAAEMIATFKDARLGDATVTQTVRLYAGVKRIDIVNDLHHVGVLHSARSADRYKRNLFYAFPLKVDGFTPRAEYAGGVVRPHDDQLRWGSQDFLAANRWVDVSNTRFGITLALHNAPIVHFGDIRYNEFSNDYKPATPYLYSFAWSNRMDGLFTLCADDMNNRFAYSFTSHAGDWDAGATTRFGWSVASPLELRWLPANQAGPLPADTASFASVDAPNVQLTVLKQTEQPGRGWIARLVETEGKAATVTLDLSRFPIDAASLCDLVENDRSPLEVNDGKVKVPLTPFAFATVRVFAQKAAPPPVASVVAEPASDSVIRLHWAAASGAIAYDIYRSVDPAAPPTAHTYIARVTTPAFADRGLFLGTTYYYHVAAVAVGNAQGAVSPQVSGRTTTQNTTPPAPVVDFDIVRETKNRLMVCWSKSPEPDTARYFVYRSERPEFDHTALEPIAVVKPSGYYLDHYVDDTLQPGRTYYYQVYPEDWAGNRQTHSATASATTPKDSP